MAVPIAVGVGLSKLPAKAQGVLGIIGSIGMMANGNPVGGALAFNSSVMKLLPGSQRFSNIIDLVAGFASLAYGSISGSAGQSGPGGGGGPGGVGGIFDIVFGGASDGGGRSGGLFRVIMAGSAAAQQVQQQSNACEACEDDRGRGGIWSPYRIGNPELNRRLQYWADQLNRDIIITGGDRDPVLNKQVGGAPNSQHLLGNAADLRISGLRVDQAALLADEARLPTGEPLFRGVGFEFDHVHVDLRAGPVRRFIRHPRKGYTIVVPCFGDC